MIIAYFLISILATTIGSMSGLGGGVIIKPILDFLGDFDISTIGTLSAVTVFTMAIVSIIKQIMYKFEIRVKTTALIGIGSIFGGILGDSILREVLKSIDGNIVTLIQNIILGSLLIGILFYMNNRHRFKSYQVENSIACILIGLLLGSIASFLSIGGGPINVCILTIFFSMNAKEAAVNSIITILFSQGSKLGKIVITTGFSSMNLSMLPYMIVGGILGGLIGSKLNKLFSSDAILKIFNITVAMLIILNVYNVISLLIKI